MHSLCFLATGEKCITLTSEKERKIGKKSGELVCNYVACWFFFFICLNLILNSSKKKTFLGCTA